MAQSTGSLILIPQYATARLGRGRYCWAVMMVFLGIAMQPFNRFASV
jgi:hypothetical protein